MYINIFKKIEQGTGVLNIYVMKKVLILDDDSYYQLAAKAAIDGAFEAVCPNCFEIVNEIKNDLGKYLTKIISEEKPCVIVTDIMYGQQSGTNVCRVWHCSIC